jgi:hypothetical protein
MSKVWAIAAVPGTMARAEAMKSHIASQADILVMRFMVISSGSIVEAVFVLPPRVPAGASRRLLGVEPRQLLPHSDSGEFTNEPKNAQEPQDHSNDYDSIQDRLNGARHGDVIIDEPKNNTNYDQDHHHMN